MPGWLTRCSRCGGDRHGECFHTGNTVFEPCDGDGRVSPEAREAYYDNRLAERARLDPLQTAALLGVVAAALWTTLALTNGVISP
ncbi:hypothetical protein [Natronolimnobius baerhuensis]|uniref:Uncharacterized protein n=1 Tax=Natronolimnobius baerhuensis TaxID=253108 RepID=A0A202E4P9_9EURY|nr:hypothetical protein [Natronolimnobius baerhuensis]OVE83168.1 hypothetical protein B2G88_17315 [Natronolimnobius baerhuensis]